jgi:hypothetical protein
MKDLGYSNGWRETPTEVLECQEDRKNGKPHKGYIKNLGRCLNEYGCLTCGYKYIVDSGD